MGSIRRLPTGRYQARWRPFQGAANEKAKNFQRRIDAERFLATVEGDKVRGHYFDPHAGRERLSSFAQRWAETQSWRQSSRDRMTHIIDSQIIPTFGTMPLSTIRQADVQLWVSRMERELAPATVTSYFRAMASIMKSAVDNNLIATSPCRGISRPKRERSKKRLTPLGVEDVRAIADAAPDHYHALILAQAGLGLRQAEACGLTVERIDFLRRTVRIDQQLVTPTSGETFIGEVKTESSNRVLPLPNSVAEALAAHLARFPVDSELSLVFRSRTGAPLRRSTYAYAFRRAARDAGVKATSHDLRHHCASLLIHSGLSVTAVQNYLGHANASETLDTYGHLWPQDPEHIRAAIDRAYRRVDVVEATAS